MPLACSYLSTCALSEQTCFWCTLWNVRRPHVGHITDASKRFDLCVQGLYWRCLTLAASGRRDIQLACYNLQPSMSSTGRSCDSWLMTTAALLYFRAARLLRMLLLVQSLCAVRHLKCGTLLSVRLADAHCFAVRPHQKMVTFSTLRVAYAPTMSLISLTY